MKKISFDESPSEVFIVPRLDDDQIDDLFYQEDEIGEMRHTAFMIECGLEEDPPDGPDVPPVPWKHLDQQQSDTSDPAKLSEGKGAESTAPETPPKETETAPKTPPVRRVPLRTSSMDDLEQLEEALTSPKKRKSPVSKRPSITKPGHIHDVEPPSHHKRISPASSPLISPKDTKRSLSGDDIGNIDLDIELANTETKSPPTPRRKLVATRSGTHLRGMRKAAEQAKKEEESTETTTALKTGSTSRAAPARRGLTVSKSGTRHGLRKATRAALDAAAGEDEPESPSKKSPSLTRRKLVATKSGTRHGLKSMATAARSAKEGESPKASPRRGLVATKSGTKLPRATRAPRRMVKNGSKDLGDNNDTAKDKESKSTSPSPRRALKKVQKDATKPSSDPPKPVRQGSNGSISKRGAGKPPKKGPSDAFKAILNSSFVYSSDDDNDLGGSDDSSSSSSESSIVSANSKSSSSSSSSSDSSSSGMISISTDNDDHFGSSSDESDTDITAAIASLRTGPASPLRQSKSRPGDGPLSPLKRRGGKPPPPNFRRSMGTPTQGPVIGKVSVKELIKRQSSPGSLNVPPAFRNSLSPEGEAYGAARRSSSGSIDIVPSLLTPPIKKKKTSTKKASKKKDGDAKEKEKGKAQADKKKKAKKSTSSTKDKAKTKKAKSDKKSVKK